MRIWRVPREAAKDLMARGVRYDLPEGKPMPRPEPPRLEKPNITAPEMPEVNIKWDNPWDRIRWHSERPDLASDDDLAWAQQNLLWRAIGRGAETGVATSAATDLLLPNRGAGPKIPRLGLFGIGAMLGGLVPWVRYGPTIEREIDRRKDEGIYDPTRKRSTVPPI
ncbi:MAG: hypothetical protein RLN70_02105 [Rhodospirillaceae bacterium]